MPINVVILAAGQGKRMHSELPKVLHRLAGRPLLAHVIATARALKPARICVVYGHGGAQVPDAVRADDVAFVKQQPQLGTGHALKQALPHLDIKLPTLVLYGDVPLVRGETLKTLCQAAGKGAALLTAKVDDPQGYGRIIRSGSVIKRIVEEKDAGKVERAVHEINTGIMVLPTRKLKAWLGGLSNRNAQREYYLTDVVAAAVKDKVAVKWAHPGAAWEPLGVNSKEQLAGLERIYQRETALALMKAGVTLSDPARIDVRGSLVCGRDVTIDVNCVFEGTVEIGDGAEIGANCVIRNTKIGAATSVAPFTMIDEAAIGKNCRIGPYARIRPGTRLARDVHIGNFVEVKASEIGAGSKANHLSYIGDSTVGKNVNVGAGTITCNYDGAYKHRTVIEDEVHIGSDVQLVAPVTVGRGADIGAGTTVWQDVPPGGLTLNEKTQITKPGWKRPTKAAKGAK